MIWGGAEEIPEINFFFPGNPFRIKFFSSAKPPKITSNTIFTLLCFIGGLTLISQGCYPLGHRGPLYSIFYYYYYFIYIFYYYIFFFLEKGLLIFFFLDFLRPHPQIINGCPFTTIVRVINYNKETSSPSQFIERSEYAPRPGRMVWQPLTWAGLEPRTLSSLALRLKGAIIIYHRAGVIEIWGWVVESNHVP